jgi:hypothetical protein
VDATLGTADFAYMNIASMPLALHRHTSLLQATAVRVDMRSPSPPASLESDSLGRSVTDSHIPTHATDIGAALLIGAEIHDQTPQRTEAELQETREQAHLLESSHIAHDNSSFLRQFSVSTDPDNCRTPVNGVASGIPTESADGSFHSFGQKDSPSKDAEGRATCVEFPPWNPSSGINLPPLPNIQADIHNFSNRFKLLSAPQSTLKPSSSTTVSTSSALPLLSRHTHRLGSHSYLSACEGPTQDTCWVIPGKLAMGPKLTDHSKHAHLKKTELTSQALMLIAGFSVFVSLLTEAEEGQIESIYDIGPLTETLRHGRKQARHACNHIVIEAKTTIYEENELIKTLPSLSKSHHEHDAVHQRRVRALGRITRATDAITAAHKNLSAVPQNFEFLRIAMDNKHIDALTIHELLPQIWEIERRLAQGDCIYIYSDDGHSRVGLLCACLLGRLYALTPYECLYRMQACHDSAKREQARAVAIHCPQLPSERALITQVLLLTNRVYQGKSRVTLVGLTFICNIALGLIWRSQSDPELYAEENHQLNQTQAFLSVRGRFAPLDYESDKRLPRKKQPVWLDLQARNDPTLQQTIAEAAKQSQQQTQMAIAHRQTGRTPAVLQQAEQIGSMRHASLSRQTFIQSSTTGVGSTGLLSHALSVKSGGGNLSNMSLLASAHGQMNAPANSQRAVSRQSLSAKLSSQLTSNSVLLVMQQAVKGDQPDPHVQNSSSTGPGASRKSIRHVAKHKGTDSSAKLSDATDDVKLEEGGGRDELLKLALDGVSDVKQTLRGGRSSNPGTGRLSVSNVQTSRTIRESCDEDDESENYPKSYDDGSNTLVAPRNQQKDKSKHGDPLNDMSAEELKQFYDERLIRHARDLIKPVERKRYLPARSANDMPLNMSARALAIASSVASLTPTT